MRFLFLPASRARAGNAAYAYNPRESCRTAESPAAPAAQMVAQRECVRTTPPTFGKMFVDFKMREQVGGRV